MTQFSESTVALDDLDDLDLPRVLYVGGLPRSGSTLLERAIARLPGVSGAGETVYLWQRGIINDERCGCGEPFLRCPYWTEVGMHAFGGWDKVDVDRVHELATQVDDVKFVPRMLLRLDGGRFDADLREYLGYYMRLYAAIKRVSGCDVVVDSSKITSLAYVLSHEPRLGLAMVHIIRDARAVAYSWTKVVKRPEVTENEAFMPRMSPGYMSLLYDGHNVLLEALRSRGVRSIRVRYEDFADDPAASLRAVARLLGRPFDPAGILSGPRTLRLPALHTVSGNPSRFSTGDVAVRRDDAWRERMPRRQRLLVGAVTAPVQAMYGYMSRPATPAEPRQPAVTPAEPATWPNVTTVVPTHQRPELVRRAIASIVGQDYPGLIETLVVFDRAEPDATLVSDDPQRPVRVLTNARTAGLAGARNTGIKAASGDLVAFCDDDDHWEPQKLRRQVTALLARPGAEFATTGMVIDYEDRAIVRLAHRTTVTHRELIRSRLAMLHSSSFLARRAALLDGIGPVDETMPQSMAEDWDLLLRAAARQPIVHVDEPLVRVQWGPTSYFADRWELRNAARLWMLEHHPEIGRDRVGAGLAFGKLAYGSAMVGRRREALRWATRSMLFNWREPRAYLAILVAMQLVDGQWIVDQLNRRGHGV